MVLFSYLKEAQVSPSLELERRRGHGPVLELRTWSRVDPSRSEDETQPQFSSGAKEGAWVWPPA